MAGTTDRNARGDTTAAVVQRLGPRILAAREHAGVSIEEAARGLGVRARTFAAWERDESSPPANRLVTLAGLLNVNLSWLLEGRDAGFMAVGPESPTAAVRSHVVAIRMRLSEVVDLVDDLERRLEEIEGSGGPPG